MLRLTRRQALAGAAATFAAASLPRRSAKAADPLKVAV